MKKTYKVMDDLPINSFKKKGNKHIKRIRMRDIKVIRFRKIPRLLNSSSKIFSIKYHKGDEIINRSVRILNEMERKKYNYSQKYWFVDGESIKNRNPIVVGIPYKDIIALLISGDYYIIIRDSSMKQSI